MSAWRLSPFHVGRLAALGASEGVGSYVRYDARLAREPRPDGDGDPLAAAWASGDHPPADPGAALASILARANVASLETRYGPDKAGRLVAQGIEREGSESAAAAFERECIAAARVGWKGWRIEEHGPREMLNAARCASYQLCEVRGWRDTLARRLLDRIEAHIVARVTRGVDGWPLTAPGLAREGGGARPAAVDPEAPNGSGGRPVLTGSAGRLGLTREQLERLDSNGRAMDATLEAGEPEPDLWPVVRIEAGRAAWLLVAIPDDEPGEYPGGVRGYGLCDLAMGFPEVGAVHLGEIADAGGRAVPGWTARGPLSAYVDAADSAGAIVELDGPQ